MNESALDFYDEHVDEYREVKHNLMKVNEKFLDENREKQRRMMLDSYIFAVFSIQTQLDRHERAFREYTHGKDVGDAIQQVNYYNNKLKHIKYTETRFEDIDKAINLLEKGKVDKAHKTMIDNFKGVGAAKAAFTLAMLGFTGKMCIDTNVQQAAGIDEPYSGVVVNKYENMCSKVLNQYSTLKDKFDPFMVQWILFDYQRGEHASHEVYFNHVLNL